MATLIAVLAGTALGAKAWARRQRLRRDAWYYVAGPAATVGHRPTATVVLPGFTTRRTHDAPAIITAVRRDLAKVADGPALCAELDRQLVAAGYRPEPATGA